MTAAMKTTAAMLLVLMAGCASQPMAPLAPSFSDTPLPVAPRSAAQGGVGGGVFNPDAGLALTSDSRASASATSHGALQETTQASKRRHLVQQGLVRRRAGGQSPRQDLPQDGHRLSADRNFAANRQASSKTLSARSR